MPKIYPNSLGHHKINLDLTEKVREAAFSYLSQENSPKEKTKQITFDNLNMTKCLWENENRGSSQIIFNIRSETRDFKEWQPLKYLRLLVFEM